MAQRALITGITGFVGGFLAEHLLACGDRVLGASPDGQWESLSPPALGDKVELLAWELDGSVPVGDAVRRRIADFRPEVIYHLAALSVPEDCGRGQPTPRAVAINVGGTRQVVALARALESKPRVLLASSSRVYAAVGAATGPVSEEYPLAPVHGYERTKLAAEEELRRAGADGIETLVIRAFPHTGPRQDPRMMLPQWAQQFANGQPGPVRIITRDAWLDLSDVRDVVRAYRLLAERGRSSVVYNVGSGVYRRSGDILELLAARANSRRVAMESAPGPRYNPVADISRLVRDTGWHATIPLEQTVADTLAWWRTKRTL